MKGQDQLRQRVVDALSQSLVFSGRDSQISAFTTSLADYVDLLQRHAFGNYRDLLQDLARHPAMGTYLTFRDNRKGDPETGRNPDQNFAQEIMQLFSIGLFELNLDGTQKLRDGQPIPTYTQDDVEAASRIFTGLDWDYRPSDFQLSEDARLRNVNRRPMTGRPYFHDNTLKSLLGLSLQPRSTPDAEAEVRLFVNRLFKHPNTAPFVSKHLIQRLVTSNPSPAYVRRVATVFVDNGRGVRGDMKSVIKAVLLDPEARDPAIAARPDYGRVRAPLERAIHLLRIGKARSADIGFPLPVWIEQPTYGIGQFPFRAPSVFGFSRPSYRPLTLSAGEAGLVAPEFQLVNEGTVSGFSSWLFKFLADRGMSHAFYPTPQSSDQLTRTLRVTITLREWEVLARKPDAVLDQVNLIFYANRMSKATREGLREIMTDAAAYAADIGGKPDPAAWLLLGVMMSGEYAVQR